MFRIQTIALAIICTTLAACPGDPQTNPDTTQADTDTPADTFDDAAPDIEPPDVPAPDTATDTEPSDITPDSSTDATTCPDLTGCTLPCPFGRRLDANGCETCACRDCAAPTDCKLAGCADALCSADGTCTCNCDTFTDRGYLCPDATRVTFCTCTDGAVTCDPHPELQCLALCELDTEETLPCPDGTTVPWCSCAIENTCTPTCRTGPDGEGWYNPCDDALLLAAPCNGCIPLCEAIGSRSEGWYDSCGGQRIAWGFCGPRRTCRNDAVDACPANTCEIPLDQPAAYQCRTGVTVPFCACDVPDAACEPVCRNIGTPDEGWYESCSDRLLQKTTCSGCTFSCNEIGTRSEGWYSSCSGLIDYAFCGTGTWTCNSQPWLACNVPL